LRAQAADRAAGRARVGLRLGSGKMDSMSDPQPHEPAESGSAPPAPADDALAFAIAAARIAHANRTEDVEVLDLRGLTSFADYFVIGTGTSDRQMHAVLDLLEEYARSVDREPYRVANSHSASWILADYLDVVIHLFDEKHRDYYDLANLWGDAPRVRWQPEGEPPIP